MRIAISAGHSSIVRGAAGPEPWGLDEYDENVRMIHGIAKYLARIAGIDVEVFADTVSTSQDENLSRIVSWHNNTAFRGVGGDDRFDVSVHFNSNGTTETEPRGTEVYHYSQEAIAAAVSAAIAEAAGLKDRGAKWTDGLYVIMHTDAPCILIEVCFCNSKPDCTLYREHFEDICLMIADVLGDLELGEPPIDPSPPERPSPPDEETLFVAKGPCSSFGGPDDDGVSPSEGLAFLYDVDQARHLFLPEQPEGTSGLARRLDPRTFYVACRWDYDQTPKEMLADHIFRALVRNPKNGFEVLCYPADWGPHEDTGRVADLSPAAMELLEVTTDDIVEVTYPAPDL